jgi:hypothetical protein
VRWSYVRRAVNVSFVGWETLADFVADQGTEYEEFVADGWHAPYRVE